jgi:hypothetical protein
MSLEEAFRVQAWNCAKLGSPFMEQLMTLLADDWPDDGPLARRFDRFTGDIGPMGASLPLRMASGLHALVLSERAPELMKVYPPATVSNDTLRVAVLRAMADHEPFLLDWVESPPQTNEVRRSAALIAGAKVASHRFNLPIHLTELGASAGLNLMWDKYALRIGDMVCGPERPALTLTPEWQGPPPPAATPRIASRAGVDLNPLNARSDDHLLRLTAYLWADQPDRLALTRAAAAVVDASVVQADAIDWLGPRLTSAPDGHLHLIQHTVAWQYFPPDTQARGRALIEAEGRRATPARPLAWLAMENDRYANGAPGAALTLRFWPGDITLTLARVDFHGRWVIWQHED